MNGIYHLYRQNSPTRLKDQGPLKRCPRCGWSGRQIWSDWCRSCSGRYLVIDEMRDAIEKAKERIEDKKRRLRRVEKQLADAKNPDYHAPGDYEAQLLRVAKWEKRRGKLQKWLDGVHDQED